MYLLHDMRTMRILKQPQCLHPCKIQKSVSTLNTTSSATEIRYAHPSIRIRLFFPYSSSNSELKLLPIPTREKKCHTSLDDKTVVAVPNLTMAIPDTSWSALPNHLPSICPNFKAIPIISSLILVSHETKECHVNRSHPKLESFKMKAEVLPKAMEYLPENQKK